MGLYDYTADNKCAYEIEKFGTCKSPSKLNKTLDQIGVAFVFIFLIESLLKIFAIGCACGNKAYFRSGWNVLDFIIVIAGLVEFLFDLVKL